MEKTVEGSGGSKKTVGGPGGSINEAGGDVENNNQTSLEKEETVAYSTFEKAVSEKKRLAEELSKYKAREKELAEKDLRDKENWKALVESKEKEALEYKAKFEAINSSIIDGMKIQAVMSALPGKLPEQYAGLIDLSQIPSDPETGEIDKAAVQRYAQEFSKKFPDVIRTSNNAKIPNDAAKGSKQLSYEEWLKLPAKEMAARLKDVLQK